MTRAELHALGVSRERLRRWIRAGQVTSVGHGVYCPAGWLATTAGDPRRRHAIDLAAVIRRNPGLVASHESAAFVHGLDILLPPGATAPPVTLTRPPREPTRSQVRGARIRVASLPASHVTSAHGVPLTTPARTAMDIARATGFAAGVVAADSVLRNQAAIKVDFAVVLEACTQWRGVVQARQVLDFCDGRAESALESVARVRFAEYGIPAPALQVNVSGKQGFIGRADFCWHEYRTIGEADGALKYAEQGTARARAQLARDERFHDAGWATVHFTWHEIYREPARTVDRLRRAFARGSGGR